MRVLGCRMTAGARDGLGWCVPGIFRDGYGSRITVARCMSLRTVSGSAAFFAEGCRCIVFYYRDSCAKKAAAVSLKLGQARRGSVALTAATSSEVGA